MRKVVIDTNVYVAFKRGIAGAVTLFRSTERIVVSTIVVGELLAAFQGGSRERLNRKELDLFLDSPRVEIVPVDEETAAFFALVFDQLKKAGTPIPTNDIWIAASAFQMGAPLSSYDAHFSKVAGISLVKMEDDNG